MVNISFFSNFLFEIIPRKCLSWGAGLSVLERFSILMDWRRIYRDRFQYANRTHYPHSEPGVEEYSKACYSDQMIALKLITYIYWTLLALYIVHDPIFF